MTIDDPTTTARQLRASAVAAAGTAARARALAHDIDHRRRMLTGRLDDPRRWHVPEVWTSAAGARSRVELQRGVGFAMWTADEALRRTLADLASCAAGLDDTARVQLHRAQALEAAVVIAD